MGWPLAVSSALMERRTLALPKAIAALSVGHLLSMLAILLPFSAMIVLVYWEMEIRIFAGLLVSVFGLYLLINTRHPRLLARVPPTKLALWSFLAALAHGAGLMLVPIYLGLCAPEELDTGHLAASELMARNAGLTLTVAAAHTFAMVTSGGAIAYAVHRWLGLAFLKKGWFDLEIVWALTLIGVGVLGVATAL